jgi:hypothetical protein
MKYNTNKFVEVITLQSKYQRCIFIIFAITISHWIWRIYIYIYMSPNTINTDIWCYTAYIFSSLFYVGEGNNRTAKRRNKILDDVKKYCRAMGWFDRKQKHMCTKNPEIIEIVQKAVKNALTECRRQFKAYRWNCSPLTWTQVFSEGGILKRRKWYVFYCGLFHSNLCSLRFDYKTVL